MFLSSLRREIEYQTHKIYFQRKEFHPSFHVSILIMVSFKEKEKLLKANIRRVSRFGMISLN